MSGETFQRHHDEKAEASFTLGDVIRQTATNFPDNRFHPEIYGRTKHYTHMGINTHGYGFSINVDGIGTKPEIAERLVTQSSILGKPETEVLSNLAYDLFAMVDGDAWMAGKYMVGAANILDLNAAEDSAVTALARGLKSACDTGQFALLNGETAQLRYRVGGYGETHVNWNAVAANVINPDKLLLGDRLKPGQPVIAIREHSVRSNGFSLVRDVLEEDYLLRQGAFRKGELAVRRMERQGVIFPEGSDAEAIIRNAYNHDPAEHMLLPWHELHPALTRELARPSTLYGPLMYAAQGRIDEPRRIKLTGAAHITGGGIPEKVTRMVDTRRLGVALDAVFPDPTAIKLLMNISAELPPEAREEVRITQRKASETWNRGHGYFVAVENMEEAKKFEELAADLNYEAVIAGEITDRSEVSWENMTWRYADVA